MSSRKDHNKSDSDSQRLIQANWIATYVARFPVVRDRRGVVHFVTDSGKAIPVDSKQACEFLSAHYRQVAGQPLSPSGLKAALSLLQQKALASTPAGELPVRVGVVRAGPGFDLERNDAVVVDLCDRGAAVKISGNGPELVKPSPIAFLRPPGMLALPEPVLDEFIPVRDALAPLLPFALAPDDDRPIVLAVFLLAALLPLIPQPILVLTGEQGAGKSWLAKALRAVIDPHATPLRRPPRDERELFIAAHNNYVLAYDNLSGLPAWLGDALCVISSGGGYAARKLYTDSEEVIFPVRRPVVLTAIHAPLTRPDLVDRMFFVEVSRAGSPRSELDLEQVLEATRARLLGALAHSLTIALGLWQQYPIPQPIRLVDVHRLACAAAQYPGFGWSPEAVDRALRNNRDHLRQRVLEASPVGPLLVEVASLGFRGTTRQLLGHLAGMAPNIQARRGDFPTSPEALAKTLTELEPYLRAQGVVVRRYRAGHASDRIIELSRPKAGTPPHRQVVSLNPDDFEHEA